MFGKHSRKILLSVAILLLGVAVAWLSMPGPSKPEPSVAPARTQAPAPAPAAVTGVAPPQKAADGSRAWVPGLLYRYTMFSDQKVSFRQKSPSAEAPPGMRFYVQGEWNIGVVSVEGERVEARVSLQPTTFTLTVDGQGPVAPDVLRTMTEALKLPFFVSFDKTGLVKLTHFEQGADVLVQGILRSVVAATQFVVSGAPKDSWEAEEQDTTGQYRAAYVRQAQGRFEKKKMSYSHVATPEGLQPLSQDIRIDVRSSLKFELAEDLWTQSLQGEETMEVDTGSGAPAATNELKVSFRLLERRMDPSLLGSLNARRAFLGSSPLASFQGQGSSPLDHHRQVLAGKTFDDLMKELRSLPKDEKERDNVRTQVLEQLRALFTLQPEEALKVPSMLRTGLDPLAASPMIGALSAASTPESIKSLVEASNDATLAPIVRTDAIAALGTAGDPNQEGVDALRKLSREKDPMFRDTAILGMGNAAYQMSDSNSRNAEALVDELRNAFRAATSPDQQAIILRALGNTRSPSVLPIAEEALRSNSVLVRESALVALRNIPGANTEQILVSRLLGDPAPEVRKAAVFACSFREPGPLLPSLGQALRSDPADGVRIEILRLLGSYQGTIPEAVTLLEWASQNDRNPNLRKMAADFLGKETGNSP